MMVEGALKEFLSLFTQQEKCLKYTELNNIENKLPWK